ncbi:NAD-dependent succinate-semialdehyde dehydrogenase [Paenibacillus sp. MY03]|jgi:succinate-semialdehyde dehydrogenase/glutarate-semialdehyde dehydrogenase|uniref:NAD-dependent succinate-semialdehyde dehydrogenase n=1 Tax=Paenibacillaceae TaxID=186822 RepID=UPI000B3C50CE|nr:MULTISPECIES: NAD-dependent succinate-semialdehyde dehydrogenase [Paenibacillaceae]OUS75689.1 NAD-dependent succinate-semialdehyde dehydrogenase [Paenibacillus sp. MY03]QTH40840.1 NAD-dependent succinate-semialdehyde dehydrogenase [Cohnella sp. LGH]
MYSHYIGGIAVEGVGDVMLVHNPATEQLAGELRMATEVQAEAALKSAEKAFPEWSRTPLQKRGDWMERLAQAIEEKRELILDVLMSETGKPLAQAEEDFEMLPRCLRYYYEEAKRLHGRIIEDEDNSYMNLIKRQPVGVVVGYLAWNFPMLNLAYKLGPVLASGCTCVLKPSPLTPLSTLMIGAIAEEIGFPAGVINVITGDTLKLAAVMNQSTIPRMITLIGSTAAGKAIIGQSNTSIKRYSLELGGNAPAIVLADADLEQAASQLVSLKFGNAGQICVSPNRVFVHESVQEAFKEKVVEKTKQIVLGWGREPGAGMGPMITDGHRLRVQKLIASAVSAGAEIEIGGNVPADKRAGYYLEPTVISGVRPDMDIFKEEIFGPVLSLLTFREVEDVVKEANSTEFGLASYVFGTNLQHVLNISETLEAGTVCVNGPHYNVTLPHGGMKESGVGKDCSTYSLEEYYYIKRISIRK